MRRVRREAVVEGRDACDCGERGEVRDGGVSAGGGLQWVAPGAAVDVAGESVSTRLIDFLWRADSAHLS